MDFGLARSKGVNQTLVAAAEDAPPAADIAFDAGVTIIGLAILAPFAVICLLIWLAHRTWVRRRRAQALT
jgi:hypothetical protein